MDGASPPQLDLTSLRALWGLTGAAQPNGDVCVWRGNFLGLVWKDGDLDLFHHIVSSLIRDLPRTHGPPSRWEQFGENLLGNRPEEEPGPRQRVDERSRGSTGVLVEGPHRDTWKHLRNNSDLCSRWRLSSTSGGARVVHAFNLWRKLNSISSSSDLCGGQRWCSSCGALLK